MQESHNHQFEEVNDNRTSKFRYRDETVFELARKYRSTVPRALAMGSEKKVHDNPYRDFLCGQVPEVYYLNSQIFIGSGVDQRKGMRIMITDLDLRFSVCPTTAGWNASDTIYVYVVYSNRGNTGTDNLSVDQFLDGPWVTSYKSLYYPNVSKQSNFKVLGKKRFVLQGFGNAVNLFGTCQESLQWDLQLRNLALPVTFQTADFGDSTITEGNLFIFVCCTKDYDNFPCAFTCRLRFLDV